MGFGVVGASIWLNHVLGVSASSTPAWSCRYFDALGAWWKVNVSHRQDITSIETILNAVGIPVRFDGHLSIDSALGHLTSVAKHVVLPLCASGAVGAAITNAAPMLEMARLRIAT